MRSSDRHRGRGAITWSVISMRLMSRIASQKSRQRDGTKSATAKIFALPNHTIGSTRAKPSLCMARPLAFRYAWNTCRLAEGVGSLVAGHSRSVFAVSTALAGPLLGLLGLEGGGFNFYGQSSRGKTTIVKAAASVWGKGTVPAMFVHGDRPQMRSKLPPHYTQTPSSYSMNSVRSTPKKPPWRSIR